MLLVTTNAKEMPERLYSLQSVILWMVVAVCWFWKWILHSCTHDSSQNFAFHILNVLHVVTMLLIIPLKSCIMNASYRARLFPMCQDKLQYIRHSPTMIIDAVINSYVPIFLNNMYLSNGAPCFNHNAIDLHECMWMIRMCHSLF